MNLKTDAPKRKHTHTLIQTMKKDQEGGISTGQLSESE